MRILPAATILSIGTVLFLALAVPRLYTGFDEREIRRELMVATEGNVLDEKVRAALDDDDLSAAIQHTELATELGRPIEPGLREELAEALGPVNTALRNAGEFASAYITGHATSGPGLAGAIISDLTVVGDVRDLITEGGKAAVGEDYSEFLLALAAIGLAAEGATIATGGSSLIVKVGVSVLKVAKRTGNLTASFTGRLTRLARAAADRNASTGVVVMRGADEAPVAPRLTSEAARAELVSTLGAVSTMARNAGAADAVKLMRFVRTPAQARDLATLTQRFGRRSRAVVELTGKTALRAFRVSIRGLRLLVAFLYSFLAWLAGLIALRFVRHSLGYANEAIRATFFRVAIP